MFSNNLTKDEIDAYGTLFYPRAVKALVVPEN